MAPVFVILPTKYGDVRINACQVTMIEHEPGVPDKCLVHLSGATRCHVAVEMSQEAVCTAFAKEIADFVVWGKQF